MKRIFIVIIGLLIAGSVGGAQGSRPAALEDVVAKLRALRPDAFSSLVEREALAERPIDARQDSLG